MSLKDIFDFESEFSTPYVATTATVATMQAEMPSSTATESLLSATSSPSSPLVQKIVATSSKPVANQTSIPVGLVAGVATVAEVISNIRQQRKDVAMAAGLFAGTGARKFTTDGAVRLDGAKSLHLK